MKMDKDTRAALRRIVRDIYERREFRECWWTGDDEYGDCGNWEHCNEGCSLCRLGRMVGMVPSEGGEVAFENLDD